MSRGDNIDKTKFNLLILRILGHLRIYMPITFRMQDENKWFLSGLFNPILQLINMNVILELTSV